MIDRDIADAENDQRILTFMQDCVDRLTAKAEGSTIVDGARSLASALARSAPMPFEPGWLEALETVHSVDPTPLGRQFVDVAPLLPWTPTQRSDDRGTDLALAPLNQVRDMGDLTVGIMYVRAGRQYPLHHHPPHELYLTIAGRADWRFGGHHDFRSIGPDTIIYNRPGDLHSAIAGETPLVAFYVLWN